MKRPVTHAIIILLLLSLFSTTGCTQWPAAPLTIPAATPPPASISATPSNGTYTLIVQNHDPASSICGQYVEAWGNAVQEASSGRLTFRYYHGGALVGADDSVKAVQSGTADICWSAATIYSGQFPISEFLQLPLTGINCARMGCDVMQDMYREIDAFKAEYRDYKVIMLGSCTYAPISTASKMLQTVDDLKGLRIRAPSSTCALWCSAVGMSPLTVATPDTYSYLQNGVIEGCLNDWHNLSAMKLSDSIRYIMDYPTPGSPIFLLMNKDKYDTLPPELKNVIDSFSGDWAARMAGIYWDSTRAWIYDNAAAMGVTVYAPSETLAARLTAESVRQNVHQQYIEYLGGFGLDGQDIYSKCMAIVSRYTEKYKTPWSESVHISDFKG